MSPSATCKRTQQLPTLLVNNVGSCCVRLPVAKSLTGFKLCVTTPNNTQEQKQQSECANGRNMQIPIMLGVVGQQYGVSLNCALHSFMFGNY